MINLIIVVAHLVGRGVLLPLLMVSYAPLYSSYFMLFRSLSTMALCLQIQWYLSKAAEPTLDAMGRVLASGTDLTAAGFTDFVFDILYISWFSLGLSILFDAAWWAMLGWFSWFCYFW